MNSCSKTLLYKPQIHLLVNSKIFTFSVSLPQSENKVVIANNNKLHMVDYMIKTPTIQAVHTTT